MLHGSAVLVHGLCLSIVGPSGHGKSTLAAALCANGAKLVSDGMTPVELADLRVETGFPRVKLSEHSIGMLGRNVGEFAQIHPASRKYYVPVESVSERSHVVLSAVICLDEGERLGIAPLSGAAAAFRLLSNAYLLGHLPEEFNPELFRRSAALANRVPVFTLTRNKVPEQLDATVQCLLRFAETELRANLDPPASSTANSTSCSDNSP